MDFLKRVLSTVVGIVVFLVICFLFILLIGSLFNFNGENERVTSNSVLQLRLDFPIEDNSGEVRFKDFSFLDQHNDNGLYKLVNAIDYAATDDRIKGISIECSSIDAGVTQLKSLRDALQRFKKSGKFVTAYADFYRQKDYYLGSVADTVFINPTGILDFKGLASQLLYFKDFEDKSGVKMEVVRMGKYKSAVEPFLDNKISDANKEQMLSYLNSIWGSLRKAIGKSRHLSPERLDKIADSLLARTPERAKSVGLVDKISFYDQYKAELKQALGQDQNDKLNKIDLLDYTQSIGAQKAYAYNPDKIALIYAQGKIINGKGTVDKIGPEVLNRALRKARRDKSVKAIVLRVNSPGGSALASDLIWRQIEITKKEKPVIVSMGDLAASGGYYISSGADEIFAEPTTITGSIGVFGILPNVKGLADKIGINAQQVKTNPNAIHYSLFEDMTEDQHDYILESIKNTYHLFKSRVSAGRNIPMDKVQEIAQGRVWTGSQAVENGLVDQLGGLDDALDYAAQQADLSDYQIKEYPVFDVNLDKVLNKYGLTMTKEEIAEEAMGKKLYKLWSEIKAKTESRGVQVLFPYSTEIH